MSRGIMTELCGIPGGRTSEFRISEFQNFKIPVVRGMQKEKM